MMQDVLRRVVKTAALLAFIAGASSCHHAPPPAAPPPPPPRPVCLVLSVGGPAGVAHIGAIRAVMKSGLKVDCIVGNSMGSLIGALHATAPGADLAQRFRLFADDYVRETKKATLTRGAALGLLFGAVAAAATAGAAIPALAAGAVGFALGADGTAKVDRDRVVLVLNRFWNNARIEALPYRFVTFYQRKERDGLELVAARSGSLAEAVGSSIANPFIFKNLDVKNAGNLDPGGDRLAMTPVDDTCRLFPDHDIVAVNVTGHPATFTAAMRCGLREVMVPTGPVDAEAVFTLGPELDRLIAAGHDATAAALSPSRSNAPRIAAASR